MRRREFITFVGGAVVWPLSARAEQAGKPRLIGLLSGLQRPASIESSTLGGFLEGMRTLGYVEGKDFVMAWRFAEGNYQRFAEFAAELVHSNVDVIVVTNPAAIRPAMAVSSTIPIVMGFSTDPVGNGFVKSLSHPGGNVTGLATSQDDTAPKQLELLGMVIPHLSRLGILRNPASLNVLPMMSNIAAAAKAVGLTIVPVEARTASEIETAFHKLSSEHVDAFILISDSLFNSYRSKLGELALNERLPSMFAQLEYVDVGGLMGYGQDYRDFFRRAATYVDKIFKGARPADLPVEQPTQFSLAINMKTAKALGLALPPTLLALADKVIE